ncbi:MAG TPA: hypothetical protein VG055_31295 [Planctomycetaceae bacterium]|nr:hypothetical protein [Planctomycetaceae bacterium]
MNAESTLEVLARDGVAVAIDTESDGASTLSVQVAARDQKGRLQAQIYHAPEIPVPAGFRAKGQLQGLGRLIKTLRCRPPKVLSARLSPARMLADVFSIRDTTPVSRAAGLERLRDRSSQPANGVWDENKQQWRVPVIRICLVGHFLQADLPRCFGRRHHEAVFRPLHGIPNIELSGRKRLALVAQGRNFADYAPIVEFLETSGGDLFAIRLTTFDTMLPFGPGSLDHLSQTFLGVGKADTLSKSEKEQMRDTFLRRPHEAFGYALRDAVLTLLLREEMLNRDRAMYEAFGISSDLVGPMKPTMGSRIAGFVFAATLQFVSDSKLLQNPRNLKRLMRSGAIQRFGGGAEGSHFGEQTGAIHGGLQFSRTPTVFWHAAKGMLRDIDLRSCYPTIAGGINVYWGRPVLLEPGNRLMSLRDAVHFVRQHANDDAWFIRASGNLSAIDNALVPSTIKALTSANFRRRSRAGCKSSANMAETGIGEAPRFRGKLYARRIESGVITSATWAMIEALPKAARREYGDLVVDAIVLYPRKLVADSGEDYDRLCDELQRKGLRWEQTIDLELLQRSEVVQLDHEDVALRFPLGALVKKFARFRREARDKHGQGSGAESAWKLTSNNMYGILGSGYLATGNSVAANVITAHGRAIAFAMFQSLNGLQLATDGCTYRLDRIPRCTLAECLAAQPDFLLRHADESAGIPFYDPADIPQNDGDFNRWFASHVAHFFSLEEANVRRLLVHQLEHKQTPGGTGPSFDGLLCDGGSNYAKLTVDDDEWETRDIKMQGYGAASKEALGLLLFQIYTQDRMERLTPITVDRHLLKLEPAKSVAKRVLTESETDEVLLPLGVEYESIKAYKVLKPSAFVFQTPEQQAAIGRQLERLHQQTGCGLDLLALRRCHKRRSAGSLTAAARRIYDYIRIGGRDLVKTFNLRKDRLSPRLAEQVENRREERRRLRNKAERRLAAEITVSGITKPTLLTGILVRRRDVARRRSLMRVD